MKARAATGERRQWPRLPLAIPVFVRTQADNGNGNDKEFLEFATALNVSAGGMLIAVRRTVPATAQVLLEIPSAPLASLATLPTVNRSLRAKVLRMQHGEGYNLLGVKFTKPLVHSNAVPAKPLRRNLSSLV